MAQQICQQMIGKNMVESFTVRINISDTEYSTIWAKYKGDGEWELSTYDNGASTHRFRETATFINKQAVKEYILELNKEYEIIFDYIDPTIYY
jgi:hypothetical protein